MRLADTDQEFFLGHFRELRLRILQVIDIHACDAQIFQAAPEAGFQNFGVMQ